MNFSEKFLLIRKNKGMVDIGIMINSCYKVKI